MPRTFDCPKCGAPVGYSDHPTGPNFTVKCNYCSSVLSEPNPVLGVPAQIIQLKIDGAQAATKLSKWLLLILAIPLIGVVLGLVGAIVGLIPVFWRPGAKSVTRPGITNARPMGGKQTKDGIATVLLKFGSEGIGPGMFSDARSIAVDGSGRIYVGEYSGGRIQVFDPTGKFITQWNVDANMPLRGMAASRDGIVYIVQSGKILRYDGNTGKPLTAVRYSGGDGFDDVATAADGGFVTGWYENRDDIVRFDSDGKVIRTMKEAISGASGRSELNTRVAIDGLGNIYALGTFNEAVFKFGPDGKFINRFGGSGNKPGQLQAGSAIAVDGRGHVYVSDIKGVQIFDADGRYLDMFTIGGHAAGMVFNDRNEMFIAARTQVLKLALDQ